MSLNLVYKGFNYTSDHNGDWSNDDSYASLTETGANATATTFSFGINPQDDEIYADSRYTDTSGEAMAIREGVAAGLSVMVRPLIDFFNTADYALTSYQPGEWRGYFNPGAAGSASANAFFASYQAMILQQAQVAAANGASSLCIGSELDQITGPAYKGYWDRIIGALRADDPLLKLTYAADWNDAASPWTQAYSGIASGLSAGTGDLATQVSFAGELDYLGIDCLAPISNLDNPSLTQLIDGWTVTPVDSGATAAAYQVTGDQSLISYFEGVAAAVGVPLLFTELGYENASDANLSPAGTSTGVEDDDLQSRLYQAFFAAWRQSGDTSLAGAYFWDWNPNASEAGPGSVGFSPQGLPAQAVISAAFHSGPKCPAETNRAGMAGYGESPAPARGTGGTGGTGALAGVADSGNSVLTVTGVASDGVTGTVGTLFATEYGELRLESDGSYIYYANNATALENAPMGAPTIDAIDFTVTDGDGAEADSTLTIEDYRAPETVAATASVLAGDTLDANSANGALKGDIDLDGVALSAVVANALGAPLSGPIAGSYGALTLNSDGSYRYVADSPLAGNNSASESDTPRNDVFPILVEGGGGAATLSTLTIAISSNVFAGGGRGIDLTTVPGGKIFLDDTLGDWDNVTGSDGSIYFTSAQASVFGGDDSIYFAGGTGNRASLYDTGGVWDGVSGSQGVIYLTSAQASVSGGANAVYFSGGSGNQASLYDTAGEWDAVNGSGGVLILNDAQAMVVGGDDSISLGAAGSQVSLYNTLGASDTVAGSNGTVYLTSAEASVIGGADTITLAGGASSEVSLSGTSGNWDAVSASNGTFNLEDAQASVFGGGNAIHLLGGSGNQISLYNTRGDWDAVDGSNGVIIINDAQCSVTGGNVAITLVGRAGNQVSLSGTSGAWDTVQGSNATLSLTGAQASVFGGANKINLSSDSSNRMSLYQTSSGNWDSVTGSEGTVYLTAAQASLVGGANTVYLVGTTGNQVSLRDTAGAWDSVAGSLGTIYLTNAQASVFGGGDSIYCLGNSGDAASLYMTNGNWDNVNGSDATLYLTSAQASVYGGGESIFLSGAGNQLALYETLDADDTVTGSGATISLVGALAVITGSSDLIRVSAGSEVTANGGADMFAFPKAIGEEVIHGFAASDKIQFSTADFANWQALSNGHILQSGADAVITYDTGDSVSLTDFSAASLTSSMFRLV